MFNTLEFILNFNYNDDRFKLNILKVTNVFTRFSFELKKKTIKVLNSFATYVYQNTMKMFFEINYMTLPIFYYYYTMYIVHLVRK